MAFVEIPGGLWIPEWPMLVHSATDTMLIDASGEKAAYVFRVARTGTLSKIGFRLGTVTTAQDLKVSFQNVNSSGQPDGTVDQYRVVGSGSVVSNTYIQTGIVSSDGTDTGTKRSVTKGDLLAVVIEFDSTVGSLNIAHGGSNNSSHIGGLAYAIHFTSSWSKKSSSYPVLTLEYDDGSFAYHPGLWAFNSNTYSTINVTNATNPDEVALKFRFPVDVMVSGFHMGLASSNGNFDIVLYDSDGSTVLQTLSFVGSENNSAGEMVGFFSSEALLKANTYYYLSMKPTSGTTDTLRYGIVHSAAMLDQARGGQDFHWAERVDAGSWTPTTTRRPAACLLISKIHDGRGRRASYLGGF